MFLISEDILTTVESEYELHWLFPDDSRGAIIGLLPWFFSYFRARMDNPVVYGVMRDLILAINTAEAHFQKRFDGFLPAPGNFGLAPLRPKNVGFTTGSDDTWVMTTDGTAATTLQSWILKDTDNTEVLFIFGYFNNSTTRVISELQMTAGGKKLPVWNIEFLNALQENYFVLPNSVTIDINSTYTVELIDSSGVATPQNAGLLGFFLSPEGRLTQQ